MASNRFPESSVIFDDFPMIAFGDRLFPAIAYTSYFPDTKYYAEIVAQGIELFCIPVYLAGRGINSLTGIGPFRKGIWTDNISYDFSDVIEDLKKLLNGAPEAAVLIRLHLDVPKWWEAKYPDQCCLLNDGSTMRQSFSSRKWIDDTKHVIKEFVMWLSESEFAEHIAGIHVAAGDTEEWVYHYLEFFEDNSEERTIAYRRWLSEKYGEDFPDTVPANINPGIGITNNTIDTFKFHASQLVCRIIDFCETVKIESGDRLLTGAFYGYHNYVFDPRKGHHALGELLKSSAIDYIASPNVYDRQPGCDSPPMAAFDSVKLHGKLWMAENDTRTYLTRFLKDTKPDICPQGKYEDNIWLGPKDKRISRMMLRNNAARMLTHKYGGWWFDMWGGWFSDPELLSEIRLCQDIARQQSVNSTEICLQEACIVTDENIVFRDASFGTCVSKIISQRQVLARTGCPYGSYLRSDMDKIIEQPLKFIWLLGCCDFTQPEIEIIAKLHDKKCGILHTDMNKSAFWYPNKNNWVEMQTFIDWQPGQLRKLYDQCGVHCFIDSEDIVYAGGDLLAIHAISEGIKNILLPQNCTVLDTLTDKYICHNTKHFSVKMKANDTCLYRLS